MNQAPPLAGRFPPDTVRTRSLGWLLKTANKTVDGTNRRGRSNWPPSSTNRLIEAFAHAASLHALCPATTSCLT